MWTTKVAQFKSKCRRCGGWIEIGQAFRYGRMPNMKAGIGYHLTKDCPGATHGNPGPSDGPVVPDPAPAGEPATPMATAPNRFPPALTAEQHEHLVFVLDRYRELAYHEALACKDEAKRVTLNNAVHLTL